MYDNRFPTKEFILVFLTLVLLCFLTEFVRYLLDIYYFCQDYVFHLKSQLTIFIPSLILLLLATISASCCKYRIQNDRLIVEEFPFFITKTELNIPIKTISKVALARDWNHWGKHIVILVDDQTYHLNALTYKEELYAELSKLVVSNQRT